MPARAADVVNRMVDIIAYIDQYFDEDGNSIRRFITRQTPNVMAGSRLPYLDAVIPFSYESLIKAIGRAIDKQEELDGAVVVDTAPAVDEGEKLSYDEIRAEANELWNKLIEANKENAVRIMKKVEMIFGRSIKLSEITEDMTDLFYLVLLDMREMAEKI